MPGKCNFSSVPVVIPLQRGFTVERASTSITDTLDGIQDNLSRSPAPLPVYIPLFEEDELTRLIFLSLSPLQIPP